MTQEKVNTTVKLVSKIKITSKLKLSFYLRQKVIIFTALAFFAYNYILFFFLTWFPSYLTDSRGMSLKLVSVINVIPWTLGFVAIAFGGVFSDFLVKTVFKNNPLLSRRIIIGFGLLLSGVSVFSVVYASSNMLVITLVAIAVFFLYFTGGIYWGVVDDIVDSSSVGSVGGVMHGIGNCAGILGPSVTGFIIQFSGSYISAFILAGIIGIAGAVGALAFIKQIKLA